MKRREVRWERMFPDELEAAFETFPIVYMPYGLCEPHGPQNALGMDALRAHSAACLAAHEYGGIVAPPYYWHVHEQGIEGAWAYSRIGEARPWLTAIPVWMFIKNMCYHLRCADSLGFHGAVVFSGHAGPFIEDVPKVLEMFQDHIAMRIKITFGLATKSRFNDDKGLGGHAGRGETSLLWATDPDCVDISRAPDPDTPGKHFAMGDLVHESDRRAGELMVKEAAENLTAIARQLLDEYESLKPENKPMTFDQLEMFWEEEIQPLIKDFEAMKDLAAGQEPPSESSRWYPNWRVRYHRGQ
jgi:creatinine amidohydrolase/Fe(II)-dependent formamide hydrolase-like protein